MSTIGQRIRKRRKEMKLTQKAVATFVGSSASAVTQWELDFTQPKGENLLKLAEVLGCSPEWLVTGKNSGIKEPGPIGTTPEINRIPVLSWVQAGPWTQTDSIESLRGCTEWIETPLKLSDNAFALKVKGESMTSPHGMSIPDGSIVVVEPKVTCVEEAKDKIVIAQQDGSGEATIKRLIQDGGDYYLLPLNPIFRTISVDERSRIIGIVKQIIINF